jgi:hypothetical protein
MVFIPIDFSRDLEARMRPEATVCQQLVVIRLVVVSVE